MTTKTHLIINIHSKCILMLLILTLGGWGKAWGQWNGVTYYTDQTIDMTGNVTMTGVMVIDGCTVTIRPNGANRTIYRGSSFAPYNGYVDGLFYLYEGGVLRIEGTSSQTITIDDNGNSGYCPLVIGMSENQVYFDYVTMQNHTTTLFPGGALLLQSGSSATLSHCNFYDNAGSNGGAVYLQDAILNCTDCEFKRNTDNDEGGGAVYCYYSTSNPALSEVNCTRCVFQGNRGKSGGALYGGITTLQDCTITGNTATDYGGAIYNNQGNLTLTDCTISGNTAQIGGALRDGETVTLTDCTISGNTASGDGGAFFFDKPCTVNCDNCSFSNNSSTSGTGGAIYMGTHSTGDCTLSLTDCTFSGNMTTASGGAIYMSAVAADCTNTLNLTDCTITGNKAKNYGGVFHGGTSMTVSGLVVIDGNTATNTTPQTSGSDVHKYPNVYYGSAKWIEIGAAGLDCGSSIGVSSYNATDPYNKALVRGSAANCLDAYQNHYFFCDILRYKSGSDFYNINGSEVDVLYSDNSPYSSSSGNLYFVNKTVSNGWLHYADASGCTISGGYVTHVNTAAGLAYLAKDIASGKNYSGKTVLLTADLAMNTHNWEPIGSACSDRAFCGTFNGQGHTITGLVSNLPYDNMGLFGYVDGGTIENTFVISGWILQSPDCAYLGDLVGYLHGGTVSNCTASQGLEGGGSTVMGSLIGKADNGAVIHSCYCAANVKNGGIMGGVVGQLASASLLNSFAHAAFTTSASTTTLGGLVGVNTGHIENCYVRADRTPLPNSAIYGMFAGSNTGTDNIVRCYAPNGAADQFNHSYTYLPGGATTGISNCGLYNKSVKPYLYKHNDNLVTMDGASSTSGSLLSKLNSGVTAGQTTWMRTMGSPLNADYPIPRYTGYGLNCVGKRGGFDLQYSSNLEGLFTSLTETNTNIFIYGDAGTQANPIVTNNNANTGIYIAEDVSIIHTSTITNAHVGVTLDPTNGSAGVHWHMFSPALSNAPLGINYTDNTDWGFSLTHPSGMPYYLFTQKSEANTTYGYFPSHTYNTSYPSSNTSSYDYYSDWDYYCYYEPEYHWINFKRNGNAHHHEDLDHPHINYQATPSATVNQNETTLVPGKGYLVATAQPTLLEAKGTLNQGLVTMPVTKVAGWRTGYNLIGNPYQSYLDFDAFAAYNSSGHDNRTLWSGNSVSNASYVILDKDGYSTHAYNSSLNSFGASRYLHPHQGFMIVLEGSGSNAYFDNSMRTTTSTNATFRDDERIDYPLVNLIATEADGNRDITTIELGRPDRGGAFKQYDLRLGKGCLYTRYEDQDYAIAFTQPGVDHVGVRFETDEEATYTLTWDMENGEFNYLHLIDNITGSDIDCLQAREYRFTATPDDYKSRFKLVFEYTGIDEPEVPEPVEGPTPFAFIMGNELVVNGPSTGSGAALLQMFDMTGRMVMEKNVSGTQTTVCLPEMTAGVYVLRLNDKNGSKVQKIIIK